MEKKKTDAIPPLQDNNITNYSIVGTDVEALFLAY